MPEISPVEMTTKFATLSDSLTDAWAFVMEHVDSVGPDPTISISPVFGEERLFEVMVRGMVELPAKVTGE